MKNKLIFWAALSGFFSIAFGAFAAHGLSKILEPQALNWIDTGLKYQFFHTLALLCLGCFQLLYVPQANVPACRYRLLNLIGFSWFAGILFFSGSLYALALGGAHFLVWLTPVGGIAFLVGWAGLIWLSLRH
ncbi:DUF423 domain-containing protein [Basfia succiniciproducens]|uniref:DUF423 domain-containing protein n=1 Tax=Basfia succiniciproducens TaxID=653940 RepID=UPI0008D56B53|nr:DUF423 domain-containing protein [Basfia succiniciproducens]SEQ08966.1 Uncharacterized membrane protein YgdD, TMEM256/DUF423 family [Basfia succiniciproducens]